MKIFFQTRGKPHHEKKRFIYMQNNGQKKVNTKKTKQKKVKSNTQSQTRMITVELEIVSRDNVVIWYEEQ